MDIEEISLDDLLNTEVTTVSKKAEKIDDAPGIVTVISRQEIEGFAAVNLGQVLRRVVGVSFLPADVFTDQSVVFRGQEMTPYNNHTLILLNGRPVRDPITGGLNATIWAGFPLDIIERIEIIRGPGSVLYGSCAYSGVINIITRISKKEGFSGRAALGGGTYNTFSQYASAVFRKGKFSGHIAFQHLKDGGPEYEFGDYNGLVSSDHFSRKSMGVVVGFQYQDLKVSGLFTDFDAYSLNGSEYWDPGYPNRHKAHFLDLAYSLPISNAFSFNVNFTYNEHHWIGGGDGTKNMGKSPLLEVNFNYHPKDKINILFGGGYETSSWNGEILNDGELSSYFIYSQVDYNISKQFKVIGGFQYNKIENIEGNFSPRLGLVVNLNDNLGFKLLYSQAFRKGYPNETSFGVHVFRGNMELAPELIRTLELQSFYNTGKMQLSLTFFSSKMKDIITRKYFPDPTIRPPFYLKYLNGGSWKSWGFELEGKFTLKKNFYFTLNGYYQKNENQEGLQDAVLHPNSMFKAGLLYSSKKLTAGLYSSFFGKPHPTTLVNSSSLVINKEPRAHNLLSLKLTYRVLNLKNNRNLTLSLEADNMFNEYVRYPDYPNKKVNSFYPLSRGASYFGRLIFNF